MAATTQLVEVKKASGPLVLWHLLSLDAPTVAALWTWFIARANHIRLPLASPVAMALAVWMLYAADRLLDARLLDTSPRRHITNSKPATSSIIATAAPSAAASASPPSPSPPCFPNSTPLPSTSTSPKALCSSPGFC